MPTRTFNQLASTLQAFVQPLDEARQFAEDNSPNLVGMFSTLTNTISGTDYPDLYGSEIASLRAAYSSFLNSGTRFFSTWLREYMRFLGEPYISDQDAINKVYDDFVANNRRVKSRGITFDQPSANPANIGSGTFRRLTVDANNFKLDYVTAEAHYAKCTSDSNSGRTKGKERFEISGEFRSRDALESLSNSSVVSLTAVHPDESLLLNSSFTSISGNDSAPTSIISWSANTSVGNSTFSASDSIYYLPPPDDLTTARSLAIKTNSTIAQKLNVRRTALSVGQAYDCFVAWNRSVDAASGTMTIRLGTQSNSQSITNQSGWNTLYLRPSLDSGMYFENFNTNDMSFEIEWSGTNSIIIDDVGFHPLTFVHDGCGYLINPGQTPFLSRHPALPDGDQFNWTDSATESVIQREFARRLGRYLPHSATATLLDP